MYSYLYKVLIFSLVIVLHTTLSIAKPFKLKGTLVGEVKPKSSLYLYKQIGTELFLHDSAKVEKQSITFKLDDETTPSGIYTLGSTMQTSVMMLIVGENADFTYDLTKGLITIKDFPAQNEVVSYKEYNQNFNKYLMSLEQRYQEAMKLQSSAPEKFQELFTKIRFEFDSINKGKVAYMNQWATTATHPYTKKIAALFVMDENTSKLNFFSGINFKDDDFSRGDWLEAKINMYFMNFVSLNAQNYQEEAGAVLSLGQKNTQNREVMFATLTKIAASIDPQIAKQFSSNHISEYPNSEYAKRIQGMLPKSAPEVGDMAPDFSLPDPDGNEIALSSLRGKIVLLDFWASWCGPCRMESPNVVKTYNAFKEKGFDIYSVSLDGSKQSWLAAIEKDKLAWPNHVSELKKWQSQAAALYHVKGIPATFLIDADGKIIAKNLRGEQLYATIQALIGQ